MLLTISVSSQESKESRRFNLIPYPNMVKVSDGTFTLPEVVTICSENNSALLDLIKWLENDKALTARKVRKKHASISLKITKDFNPSNEESYQIDVIHKNITIKASHEAGLYYGIQSLKQLFRDRKVVPTLQIKDEPYCSWRAFMLDEARHFKGKAAVKQILDEMARLKMNTFHWHLTDSEGWRIDIQKYPLLCQIGAFRKDSEAGTWKSGKLHGVPHSGFYTQEDIKEIVAYAADKHIRVVPEIEMPGHSAAAVAAYPWLSATGEKIEVPVKFGKHKDMFDVTKPEVIEFIKNVLSEIFELFPSKYVHVGGDEVIYDQWLESERVCAYMKEHNLVSPADLQIQFTNEISKFIEENGKVMIGWNEILGSNIHAWQDSTERAVTTELSQNAVVQFWKGDTILIREALEKGHNVINSYHKYTYLDMIKKPLAQIYSFNPKPIFLDEKLKAGILGMGCQMWGEWIPTIELMQERIYPKLAAYAEIGWTLPINKDYEGFTLRIDALCTEWEAQGIKWNKSILKRK